MLPIRRFRVVGAAALAALLLASTAAAQDAADGPAAPEKGPPLPFITLEGVGGGAITPMAYLVNPAPEGDFFGKPSVAFDYIGLGSKNADAILFTENFCGRIEFGFAADRLGLGTLPSEIQTATGVNIGVCDVFCTTSISVACSSRRTPTTTSGFPPSHSASTSRPMGASVKSTRF